MINFFRKKRKSLADDHSYAKASGGTKALKYTRYAIGEIWLVVIGILIALQLNSLKELRQKEQIELNILNNIKTDLIVSQKDIKETYRNNQYQIDQFKYLYKVVSENGPYSPKLDSIFGFFPNWSSPYLTFTSYETLKNKGVDFIQNDNLKNNITSIYESDFASLINDWDKWEWQINQNVVMPYFAETMRSDIEDGYIARPNNYENLKKDDRFLNILSLIIRTRKSGVNRCLRIDKKLDILIEGISKELKNRNFKK